MYFDCLLKDLKPRCRVSIWEGGPKSFNVFPNVTKNMPTILINSNEFLLGFSSKFDIKSIFIYNFVLIEKQKILSSKRGSYS